MPAVPSSTYRVLKESGYIIEKLSATINEGLANPTVKVRISQLVALPLPLGAAEFSAFVAAETKKWGEVVRLSGAKPE